MSILDGRSTVTLYPATTRIDAMGGLATVWGDPVTVRCTPQWATPRQRDSLGLDPDTVLIVVARDWDAPALSRFTWDGCTFEQVGTPKRLYGSARTTHVEVYAKQIAATVLPPRIVRKQADGAFNL